MMKQKYQKRPLNDTSASTDDLAFWMSKTPEERIAAVEYLRNQFYGHKGRPDFSALPALLNADQVEYMIV